MRVACLMLVSLWLAPAIGAAQATQPAQSAPDSTVAGSSADPGAIPPPPDGGVTVFQPGQPVYAPSYRPSESEGVRIPSRIATRIRVLETDLNILSSRGSSGIVDGILNILSGGISITIGVLIDDAIFSNYLYLYGGASIARGIIDLALTPNPTDAAIRYSHMPMGNIEEVKQRLRYGEQELESIADMSMIARILDASISIGVGLLVIPVFLGPRDYEITSPFDALVLVGAGVSIITGLMGLLTRTNAERRWTAYSDLRGRLSTERQQRLEEIRRTREEPEPFSLQMSAVPLPVNGEITGLAVIGRGTF